MIIDDKSRTVIIESNDLEAYNLGKKMFTHASDDGWHNGKQGLFVSTKPEPFVAWLDDMAYSIDPRIPREEKDIYVNMIEALEEADNIIIDGAERESIEPYTFSTSYTDQFGHIRKYDIGSFDHVSIIDAVEIKHDAFSESMPIDEIEVTGDNTILDSYSFACADMKHLTVQTLQTKAGYGVCPVGMCFDNPNLESFDCEEPVYRVEAYAFDGSQKLAHVNLQSATNIQAEAFKDTNLNISKQDFKSLRTIGKGVFDNCPNDGTMTVGEDFDKRCLKNIPETVENVYKHKPKEQGKHSVKDQRKTDGKTVPTKFTIITEESEQSEKVTKDQPENI